VEEVRWCPVDDLPPLGFDHREIVDTARRRIAAKVAYEPIAFTLLPERFTMRALREVHEALSGHPYEPSSNFWRDMVQRWGVEDSGEVVRGGPGRPAALYTRPETEARDG
jgi:hypothetical protein